MRSEYHIKNGLLYKVSPYIAGVVDSYTLCKEDAYDFLCQHYNLANGTHPEIMQDHDYVIWHGDHFTLEDWHFVITMDNFHEFEFNIYFED